MPRGKFNNICQLNSESCHDVTDIKTITCLTNYLLDTAQCSLYPHQHTQSVVNTVRVQVYMYNSQRLGSTFNPCKPATLSYTSS